jgi:hypothetical protein
VRPNALLDTEEQKEKFRNDPKAYEDYIRKIEEDLGSRFPMVSSQGIQTEKTLLLIRYPILAT